MLANVVVLLGCSLCLYLNRIRRIGVSNLIGHLTMNARRYFFSFVLGVGFRRLTGNKFDFGRTLMIVTFTDLLRHLPRLPGEINAFRVGFKSFSRMTVTLYSYFVRRYLAGLWLGLGWPFLGSNVVTRRSVGVTVMTNFPGHFTRLARMFLSRTLKTTGRGVFWSVNRMVGHLHRGSRRKSC